MRCKSCHYSLAGLTVRRCPECGRAFEPGDPRTWESEALTGRRRLSWLALVAIIVLTLFLIAAVIPLFQNYPIWPF